MGFEFDLAKSQSNQRDHGIDFKTAQELWLDERGLENFSRVVGSEYRYARVAQIEGKIWTAILTYRKKRKRPNGKRKRNIRLISVRRARPEEEIKYRQTKGHTYG